MPLHKTLNILLSFLEFLPKILLVFPLNILIFIYLGISHEIFLYLGGSYAANNSCDASS